jgi:hypothetical protein
MTNCTPSEAESSLEEREHRLIDAVVSLTKSLRDERERLASRLAEVEHELSVLAVKLAPSRAPSTPVPPPPSLVELLTTGQR